MKKVNVFIISLILLANISSRSDEGMWIPLLLQQLNESEMQSMGMKLTAEDIYSINKSCLKDGIVLFGGGCTAEIVSDKGLLLTNHHCGYGRIQAHSSIDNDYLTNGFWASNNSEELKNPGLTVTLLIRMEDVTEKVLKGLKDDMRETGRENVIQDNINKITGQAVEGTHYKAIIKPFYYGNEYYMFITETFKDIRLVGAPPSNIGKFGGDTDNWMWPRHTGDFSVFRIYVDKDNKPASYSKDNVPYKPKYHIPISLKGYDKGDFTFVFGYPARTQEYLPSYAIEMITIVENPVKIDLRQKRLDIMAGYMNQSNLIRIQYSAKYAGISNYWKKMIGENRGIKKLNAITKKQELEAGFIKWANSNAAGKAKYGNLISDFETIYKILTPLNLAIDYLFEAGFSPEIIKFSSNFKGLVNASKDKTTTDEKIAGLIEQLKQRTSGHFKNYNIEIDKKIFFAMFNTYYNNLDKNYHPEILKIIEDKYKGDISRYAEDLYSKSIFASEEKVTDFLNSYKASKYKKIEKDPANVLVVGLREYYFSIKPEMDLLNSRLKKLQRIYMKALMEYQPDKRFYPDANSTMRVTYGKVDDYSPRDAVFYKYFTTLDGILEKEDPAIYDYVVEGKLKELVKKKDYGQYADKDGSIHVCFTASNHTTGGNSGSPLLNADGHLIGINFDRNWEGTMSDLMYDPDQCRNISIDIRYCLFIIDKFAGAKWLIDEMTLVK